MQKLLSALMCCGAVCVVLAQEAGELPKDATSGAASSEAKEQAIDTAAGLAELRKEIFTYLKTISAKGPIKDVPWDMGGRIEKAVIEQIDGSKETLRTNVGGMQTDLKWRSLENKRVLGLLKSAGGSGAELDPEAAVLSAALLASDEMFEGAEALLSKVILKDPTVSERYAAWKKKVVAPRAPPKPKPVAAPAVAKTPASSPALPPSRWEPTGLGGGGAMYAPAISPHDPKTMMLCSDMSGAYLTFDGGKSWRIIHYSELQSSIRCRPAFSPLDPNTIFSGRWNKIRVTHDRGEHWQDCGDVNSQPRGEIAIDPSNPALMLVGTAEGASRSIDGGKTWKACATLKGEGLAFHFDQTSPPERRVCFSATREGIWRSDDAGTTWTEKSKGLPRKELHYFSGGSNAKDKLCMLYCSVVSKNEGGKFSGGVYRSADRGETWEQAMGPGINLDTQKFEYGMGDVAQYRQVLTNNIKPNIVWAMNSNTGLWPPHHTACFRSDDAGRSWRATFFPDPRFKGFNVAYDYQMVPTGQYYQGAPFGAAIAPSNPEVVMFTNTGQCFVTGNGGANWDCAYAQPAPGATPPDKKTSWLCAGLVVTSTWNYYVDPSQPNRHYICYTDCGFATSLDGGKSWRWWGDGEQAPWGNTCYELAIDPKIPGRIWGAFSDVHDIPNGNVINGGHRDQGGGGICVSSDFAQSWKTSHSGLPVKPALSVVLDPKSPPGNRTLYASIWEHGVYKSTDDGKTWTHKSKGLGAAANMRVCKCYLHPDGTLFVIITAKRINGKFSAEGTGLYRSTDGAESWQKINSSQSWLWPKDFTVDPGNSKLIYVGACDTPESPKEEGGLYRTLDGGQSWKRIERQGSQHFGAYLHPKRPGWIYMTLAEGAWTSGLWLSKDGGAKFEPIKDLPFQVVQRVAFDPSNEGLIYVITFGGSIWRGPAE